MKGTKLGINLFNVTWVTLATTLQTLTISRCWTVVSGPASIFDFWKI